MVEHAYDDIYRKGNYSYRTIADLLSQTIDEMSIAPKTGCRVSVIDKFKAWIKKGYQ